MKSLATIGCAVLLAVVIGRSAVRAQDRAGNAGLNRAPAGFTLLFDGKDVSGWRGIHGDINPQAVLQFSPEELTAKQARWNADRDQHWSVDTAKGALVSDGKGVFLGTDRDYGDFELYVDWLMVNHNGDSGIYLRGYPQVQIWDPDNPREVKNGAPRGSGALWNDNPDNPGKWPLVKADNPVGVWNTFRIKIIGIRVWVWLNGLQTVNGQVLDNYFDRSSRILSAGPIELQTHGSEMRFRNIYVREIAAEEAKATLAKASQ